MPFSLGRSRAFPIALLAATLLASITVNIAHAQQAVAVLPSGLAPVSQVMVRGAQLALDSNGTLFRQDNPAKGWRTVHQQWAGKAVELLGIPALTTAESREPGKPENYAAVLLRSTAALHWVSLDRGKTWKPSTLDDVRRNDVKWSGD